MGTNEAKRRKKEKEEEGEKSVGRSAHDISVSIEKTQEKLRAWMRRKADIEKKQFEL